VVLDTLRHQPTGSDIKSELNEQLVRDSWKIKGYDGHEVEIVIESITVRPKYSPKKSGKAFGKLNQSISLVVWKKTDQAQTFSNGSMLF